MKFNYALTSRILIALLFVVAGLQKLGINIFAPSTILSSLGSIGESFNNTAVAIGTLGIPLVSLVTALVIIIEIPVAIAYAWGYRVCITGGILVAFTVVATVLVHRDINSGMNLVMALKNIAIIGGILATTGACSCGRCYTLNPKA
ncbi:MAG: DoxX family protein [Candidatus Paceibacterota bacterium]